VKISPTLASVLKSARAEFNAKFAAARHVYPHLDAATFTAFVAGPLDQLVQAVEKTRPDRVGELTLVAYDAGLELVGQKLVGPDAIVASIEEGWRRILPKAASLVASAPGRLIPHVCNAIHQLATISGARPAQWITAMEAHGPACADVDTFLILGQLAGWQAGLAHFRQGAIAAAHSLREDLVLAVMGANSGCKWPELKQRLLEDPWFDPAAKEQGSNFRIAAQVGSFRGFGGLFVEPPRVVPGGEHFLVQSGDSCWLLTADAFGATFHRASQQEFDQAGRSPALPREVRLDKSRVVSRGVSWTLPPIGEITSAAANQTTLAMTTRLSHTILLVALPR
jgi:hypothetical protein